MAGRESFHALKGPDKKKEKKDGNPTKVHRRDVLRQDFEDYEPKEKKRRVKKKKKKKKQAQSWLSAVAVQVQVFASGENWEKPSGLLKV